MIFEENTGQLIVQDEDTALKLASGNYISSLTPGSVYEDAELVSGMMTSIHQVYEEHNIVAEKSKKWKYPSVLPNICVADLLLYKYTIRLIDYGGEADEMPLAVYQSSGSEEGTYSISEIAIRNIIRKFRPNASVSVANEVRDLLKTNAIVVKPTTDRDLIAVNNGIFDYKKKQLLPFSPEYIFTAKSKVDYVPNAVRPTIKMHDGELWDPDTWFESLSDNPEIVKLLWQVVGAIIRPNVRWDKAVCFYSQKGMNGKGKVCELMKQLCGERTYASIPFDKFEKEFELESLTTATAIICDENGTNEFTKNASNFKALTTGDSFSLSRKFKQNIKFRFTGLIVECVNSLPKISDNTDSLYRRFLIISFEKTFVGQERKYIKQDYLKRPETLQYVLWKVLNTDYYEFDNPQACQEMLQDYKNFNCPVRQFVDSIFPRLSWDLIPQQFLRDLYHAWRAKHNPGAALLGDRTLDDKIANIILNDYSDEWDFVKGKQYRVTQTNMCKPEHLIAEYGLTDWMNKTHKGNNIDQICSPDLADKYKGYVRKK